MAGTGAKLRAVVEDWTLFWQKDIVLPFQFNGTAAVFADGLGIASSDKRVIVKTQCIGSILFQLVSQTQRWLSLAALSLLQMC